MKIKQDYVLSIGISVLAAIFYLIALFKYPLSYGIDGPYYDLQILSIFQTGLPSSNDPPLVYYFLAFFSLFFGTSAGIKVGMALIGASSAIPAYFITKNLLENRSEHPRLFAALSAFLVTFNTYALRMIEDFMQNFAGVVFYLMFLLYSARTVANPNRKNMSLTTLSVILSLLTHLYIAMLSLTSLGMLLVVFLLKKRVDGKSVAKEMKVLAVTGIGVLAFISMVALLIPSTLSTFSKVTSFVQSLGDSFSGFQFIIFINLPYLFSLYLIVKHMRMHVKAPFLEEEQFYLLSNLLNLAIILGGLTLPIIPMTWASRFVLMAFAPLALITPYGLGVYLAPIENEERLEDKVQSEDKVPSEDDRLPMSKGNTRSEKDIKSDLADGTRGVGKNSNQLRKTSLSFPKMSVTSIIGILILVNLLAVTIFMNTMGPTITTGQYRELEDINNYLHSNAPEDAIIVSTDSNLHYWAQLTLDYDVIDSQSFIPQDYQGRAVYTIVSVSDVSGPFTPSFQPQWFPLLPFGLELGQPPKVQGNQGNPQNNGGTTTQPPNGGTTTQPTASPKGTEVFSGIYYSLVQAPNL